MARQKPTIRVKSYGIYTKWHSDSRDLPKIREFTTTVPAEIDIEFGLIVNIVGGKNLLLGYCIDHPGIKDSDGEPRPPFDGEVYIKTNDWDFYLGDTIWTPVEDKLGTWKMRLEIQGKTVAEKSFEIVSISGDLR